MWLESIHIYCLGCDASKIDEFGHTPLDKARSSNSVAAEQALLITL